MTQDFTLANATLVLPDRVMIGRLDVVGGEIAHIAEGNVVPPGAENCRGNYIAPRLIDLYTEKLERDIQPCPKVD